MQLFQGFNNQFICRTLCNREIKLIFLNCINIFWKTEIKDIVFLKQYNPYATTKDGQKLQASAVLLHKKTQELTIYFQNQMTPRKAYENLIYKIMPLNNLHTKCFQRRNCNIIITKLNIRLILHFPYSEKSPYLLWT